MEDNGGVYLVPAFTGLGSPYNDPYATGTIIGITRGTTKAHICRAALECMAYQVAEAFHDMEELSGTKINALRADGGGAKSDFLCQFQADILGVPVERPVITETTCLGAAYLAGLAVGYYKSVQEVADNWQVEKRFDPRLSAGGEGGAHGRLEEGRAAGRKVAQSVNQAFGQQKETWKIPRLFLPLVCQPLSCIHRSRRRFASFGEEKDCLLPVR